MRRPRRNHTAAFKAKVALAALKGDRTLAELAEKYDVHANQITQGKTQLLDGAIGVFMSPAEKRGGESGPSAKEMQAKIGQLALRVDFLGVALIMVPSAPMPRSAPSVAVLMRSNDTRSAAQGSSTSTP